MPDSTPGPPPPPEWMLALAEIWVDWLRPVVAIAAVGLLAAAYLLDWLTEPTYALVLAGVFALAVAVVPAVQGAFAGPRWAAPLVLLLGGLWAVALVGPVWRVVTPGEPVATASLARGERLRVERAPCGALTLLVSGEDALFDLEKNRELSYRIGLGDGERRRQRVSGDLSRRTVGKGRGPGGGGQTLLHAANLHSFSWKCDTPLVVRLAGLKPSDGGRLEVSVLPWAVPWTWLLLALGAALLVALALDGRWMPRRERTFLPHAAGVTLAFVAFTRDALEPLAPVKPMFGSVLVAAAVGVVGGSALSVVVRWLLRRREDAPRGGAPAGDAA